MGHAGGDLVAALAGGRGGGVDDTVAVAEDGDGAGVAVEGALISALLGVEFLDPVGDGDGVVP
ncbi:hypothetical protein LH935_28340 (plasmid) [Gordonia polyisoprenivorans]|uniref:hypothetical protein n=1 Tax=Gordonia polyisoprenivorans TaxID=84595 RepID=UPI0022344B04|nr:hypothetical protein LH935_28340 [Gordonia polyisoprenivorans]